MVVRVLLIAAVAVVAGIAVRAAEAQTTKIEQIVIDQLEEEFTGDLPDILDRRVLRVLVAYSRTNFFFDGGTTRGFEYELLHQYDEMLNKPLPLTKRVDVVFIPVRLDRLVSDLAAGRGDVAAGGLTVTPERLELVAFTRPYLPNVREVVVSGANAKKLKRIEDLSGRTVHVRAGSSYAEHLRSLSEQLVRSGARAIEVVEAPENLATEDLLEMVNAGVLKLTVADEHIARAWEGVLPSLVVHDGLVIHSGGSIAWAVRRDNAKLRASLDSFIGTHKKGSLLGNIFFKRYFSEPRWITNPVSDAERAKLEELRDLFQKYGKMYDFDWLALAAMAYQESGLDQTKRSRAGAVGIMQIKPSTAADRNVGITGVDQLENNIHAAAKYLAFLRDRYFSEPEIPDDSRFDFSLAAYNAGPARIAAIRRKAEQQGFDPNRWFFDVETVAAAEIGRETVRYVSNINKYFVAYRLSYRGNLQRQLEMESMKGARDR